MRSSFVAATGLALLLAASTYGQAAVTGSQAAPAAPPADAPMDKFTPPGSKAPSEGWVEADKSADAAARGLEYIKAAQQAYAGAGDLSQDVTVEIALPQGKQKQGMNIRFSKANDMKFAAEGIEIVVIGDKAFVALDSVKDKYVELAKTGTIAETLANALPGFALPTPVLAYREGTATSDVLAPIGMGTIEDIRVVGSRNSPTSKEVLLAGSNGEVLVAINPATGLITTCALQMTPPGLPPEIRLNIDVALADTVGPLSAPIAFVPGERTKVTSVDALAGTPGASADAADPDQKVKVGDVAPVAELALLDGGAKVNLASLKGKVVVIDFWATWCGPCRKGLPLLQAFATKMQDNPKVVVYAVNSLEAMSQTTPTADEIEKARGKAAEYWAKQKFTMPCLLDSTNSFINEYGFAGIPATVVIDPTGKIAALHLGFSPNMGEMLEADVAKALAAGSPSADTTKPAAPAGQ